MPVIQILTNREYRFELLSRSSQFSTRNIDQKIVWNCWEKIVEKRRKQIWKAISIYDIRVKINMFNMEIIRKKKKKNSEKRVHISFFLTWNSQITVKTTISRIYHWVHDDEIHDENPPPTYFARPSGRNNETGEECKIGK